MKNPNLSVAAVALLALGAAHGARAQSIDYGSLEQLFDEPVTTSATGSPQRATAAPVDMTIVTADQIKRSGATDLPTILSRVAGIDVINWSAGHADLSVRGYNQVFSPRLLVLINGRAVYLDHFGYTSWASLPVTLAEIRQIEVVRGPNSALFGFNAVGGVINIITFNPKYDAINSIEAHGGTQDSVGGSVVKTLHLGDRVAMRLSAGGERQNEWRNTAGYHDTWNAHGMADAIAQLAPSTELRLEGSWARSGIVEQTPSGVYNPASYTTTSLMATLTSDTAYGQIQARASVNTLDNVDSAPALGVLRFKNQVEVVSLQDLFKVGARNTVRIALEYRDNQGNTTPIASGHIGYSVLAPSAMWTLAATDKLSLTAAGRADHLKLRRTGTIPPGFFYSDTAAWDRTIDSLSANLSAVYSATNVDTVRATYARGIQIPTLVELGGFQAVLVPGPFMFTAGGAPDLQPAIVSNYQLSYGRDIPAWSTVISGKVFLQQTDDVKGGGVVQLPRPALGFQLTYQNASNSRMTGVELAASGKVPGGFHWSADTTYTQVTDHAFDGVDLSISQIAFASTTPRWRGNLAAGWSNAAWSADAYVHYVSAFDSYVSLTGPVISMLDRVSPYVTLAGRVSYRLSDGLIVAVSGQNLGTEQQVQAQNSGLKAPRRVLLTVSKSW